MENGSSSYLIVLQTKCSFTLHW